MLKNYNYMLTIMLYPFIMVLSYLRLANILKSNIYTSLIIIMLFIFIPSFVMSLYSASEEILKSKNKKRIILLLTLSIFYLPIYYTKYIYKEEKYLGYILSVISIVLTIITFNTSCNNLRKFFTDIYKKQYAISVKYTYKSINKLFTIDVDSSFRCNEKEAGEYAVSCERLNDDSFIGIYSYDIGDDDEKEVEEKLEFHVNQTLDYISEKGYEYVVGDLNNITKIEYNDNVVLIMQKNYTVKNNKYSLIIMKEMPREYINFEEYQKMIDSITFLNYNV